MKEWKQYYLCDLQRYGDNAPKKDINRLLKYFRKCQFSKNKIVLLFSRVLFRYLKNKRGIELSEKTTIGKGLYLNHAYGITIHPNATIGRNCNIHKGVSIGQENRGKRLGVPTIGNDVWIGINACVVGKVHIGDDVLIAPNTFVNCDVPSHCVVFGNPCIIKIKECATKGYINNKTSL